MSDVLDPKAGDDDVRAETGADSSPRELLEALERERAHGVDVAARLRVLEVDATAWRKRAEHAERGLAAWEEWAKTPGARLLLRTLALRARMAPPGSRRERVLRAAAGARSTGRQSAQAAAPRATKAVLFLSGRAGATKRYRCDHRAEQLRLLGAAVDVRALEEVDLHDVLGRYGCVILHRVGFDGAVHRFINEARNAGTPVIFDTDDLNFDSRKEQYVPESGRHDDGIARQRQTLMMCDGLTVSTAPLKDAAAQFHERVFLAPNVVSEAMVALADSALDRVSSVAREGIAMAYLSGTPTHDHDFLEAADAVLWALRTYPVTRFVAVGRLSLDARFDEFGERVERVPTQPWEALSDLLARIDVNLGPLQRGNPFSDCKSCLKYVEAALLGVPTIASPRPDFARAIEHGRNGLLAETPPDWQEALRTLIESPELRQEIGRNAFEDVRRHHTTTTRAVAGRETMKALVGTPGSSPLVVNWLAQEPSGPGHSALRLATQLAAEGTDVRLYFRGSDREDLRLARTLEKLGDGRLRLYWGVHALDRADVSIATDAETALALAENDRSLFRCYFVTESSRVSQELALTYRLPLFHVCAGRKLAQQLESLTGRPAESIELPADDRDFRDSMSWSASARRLATILDEACFVRLELTGAPSGSG